jgi:hypothetical protein
MCLGGCRIILGPKVSKKLLTDTGEAKATDLVTTGCPSPRRRQKERRYREAELADLLV